MEIIITIFIIFIAVVMLAIFVLKIYDLVMRRKPKQVKVRIKNLKIEEKRKVYVKAYPVAKVGIKKQTGYRYFVDSYGDISRLEEGSLKKPQKVEKVGVKKVYGYYYYVNDNGDIWRTRDDNGQKRKEQKEFLLEGAKKRKVQAEQEAFAEIKTQETERLKIERMRKKARQELLESEYKNIPEDERMRHIPEDVKEFVWRRDGGKCIECGSKERLEFDHIIPFSKGGSNTARNIQLLCERCNRSKKDKI